MISKIRRSVNLIQPIENTEIDKMVYRYILLNVRSLSMNYRFSSRLHNILDGLPSSTMSSTLCTVSGRSRSTYRYFKLTRMQIKKYLQSKQLIGIRSSSW
jgi:ribosomal protein S14